MLTPGCGSFNQQIQSRASQLRLYALPVHPESACKYLGACSPTHLLQPLACSCHLLCHPPRPQAQPSMQLVPHTIQASCAHRLPACKRRQWPGGAACHRVAAPLGRPTCFLAPCPTCKPPMYQECAPSSATGHRLALLLGLRAGSAAVQRWARRRAASGAFKLRHVQLARLRDPRQHVLPRHLGKAHPAGVAPEGDAAADAAALAGAVDPAARAHQRGGGGRAHGWEGGIVPSASSLGQKSKNARRSCCQPSS